MGYSEAIFEGKENTISIYRAPEEHIDGMRSFILGELDKDPSWIAKHAEIVKKQIA